LPNRDPLELLVECLTVIGLAVEYERTARRAVRERDMARIMEEKGERERGVKCRAGWSIFLLGFSPACIGRDV
jgi:hypothetical protein